MRAEMRLPEGVSLVRLTPEIMKDYWERLKDFDVLYSDSTHGDELGFYQRLMSSTVLETEGGIMLLDGLVLRQRGQVHVWFWDHKLSSRSELLKGALRWVFEVYDLNRVEAIIPEFSKALERFLVRRMGFTFEGKLRERLLWKGHFKDLLMFSILRKEIENG